MILAAPFVEDPIGPDIDYGIASAQANGGGPSTRTISVHPALLEAAAAAAAAEAEARSAQQAAGSQIPSTRFDPGLLSRFGPILPQRDITIPKDPNKVMLPAGPTRQRVSDVQVALVTGAAIAGIVGVAVVLVGRVGARILG